MTKFGLLPILVLSAALQAAHIQPVESTNGYEERLVIGTVVAVKAERSLITIREPDLLGNLRIRFKCYQVKQPFLLYEFRSGDKITAVFSAKDNMLHRLRHVQSYRSFVSGPSR